MKIMRNRRNRRITLIDQKLGNNFAVFEIYLPFVGVFNLTAITFHIRKIRIQTLRYEMVYITKLFEIHQRRGCKETPKGLGVGN